MSDERRTILLLSDDCRLHSGVGNVSRDIIRHTCDRFDWVQVGAAAHHPEQGKAIDMSEYFQEVSGVEDASVIVYPYTGYGNQNLVRNLMMMHRPAAIMHFTDPRYWEWLYAMEAEIREHIPIIYYHVWDNGPTPRFNRDFYRSCDGIACISKLTQECVESTLGQDNVERIDV